MPYWGFNMIIELETVIKIVVVAATAIGGIFGGYKVRAYRDNGRPKIMSKETKEILKEIRFKDTCDARCQSFNTQLGDIKHSIDTVQTDVKAILGKLP